MMSEESFDLLCLSCLEITKIYTMYSGAFPEPGQVCVCPHCLTLSLLTEEGPIEALSREQLIYLRLEEPDVYNELIQNYNHLKDKKDAR